jgi:hypothetical protein
MPVPARERIATLSEANGQEPVVKASDLSSNPKGSMGKRILMRVILLVLFCGIGVGAFYGYTHFMRAWDEGGDNGGGDPGGGTVQDDGGKASDAKDAEVAIEDGDAAASDERADAAVAEASDAGVEVEADAETVAVEKKDAAPVAVAEKKDAAPVAVAVKKDAAPVAVEEKKDAGTTTAEVKPIVQTPGASGKLVIESHPDAARIYLDGTLVGNTPMELDSTGDKHKLALLKPGFKLYTGEVGGSGRVTVPLEEVTPPNGPGGIKVRCSQKQRYYIFLDGHDVGQVCPTERIGVEVGTHTIEIYDPVTDSRKAYRVDVRDTHFSVRLRID